MKKLLFTEINRILSLRAKAILPTTAILVLTLTTNVDGQTIINAGTDQNLPTCGANTTLTATFTPTQSTSTYTVSTIAYNADPYNQGTLITLSDDEVTLNPIQMPFSVCYFGNTYNSLYISSNNWVGFSANQTPGWATVALPNASGAAPKNSIMAPWQDINPAMGGQIRYQVYGTAPFRRFVISYVNVPMYLCTGLMYSSQIKIYETTNIIETHIANKPLCTDWNGGNAVHGLTDATGTNAVIVAGRNNTQWTTANEGMRFTPSATAPNYTFEWVDENNTVVGTTASISVSPLTTTEYTARVSYSCPTVIYTDKVKVTVPVNANAGADVTVCSGIDTQIGLPANANATYQWMSSQNISNSNTAQPTINIVNNSGSQATYPFVVRVTENGQCFAYDTMNVTVNPAPVATFTNMADQCITNNQYTLHAIGSFSPAASFSWEVDGAQVATTPNYSTSFATPGIHTVKLVVVDGCTSLPYVDSANVLDVPAPNFGSDVVTGCVPLTVQFTDSTAGNIVAYKWDFGTGSANGATASYEFENSGRYDVTVTVTSAEGCSASFTREDYIWVKPRPVANFAVSSTTVDAVYDPYVSITNLSDAQYYFYSWGDGQTTTSPYADHAYTTPGTYTITQIVKNGYGCTDTTSRMVVSNPSHTIYIPTAFTPNNDNNNEIFKAEGNQVENFTINIFNRWGQQVFASSDMRTGWDGSFQGATCQPGVYTYKVTYNAIDVNGVAQPQVLDGTVNLIR